MKSHFLPQGSQRRTTKNTNWRILTLLLLSLCCVISCHVRQGVITDETQGEEYILHHAEGFRVTCHSDYTVVEVRDPWNPLRNLQRYVLVDRNKEVSTNLPEGTLIRTPIQKIGVYTAVHCAALDELGVIDAIIGVCESRFIKSPAVLSRLTEGLIADLGESVSPNTEKMMALGVEVILTSPFQNAGYGSVEKTGIPIIECADYMETTPLGRAEWLRFLGLFTGQTTLADSLFYETEARYMDIKNKVAKLTRRPTVFTEKKYGSVWYVPSGQSYMAQLYRDAGADYEFSHLPGSGGTPLSFETVLDKAIHADFWLFNYNSDTSMTYQFLEAEYALYAHFDAFKLGRVYGCNTHTSFFYEEAPIHPDYLLRELVAIFHPEKMPEDYPFRYFHLLL